MVKGFLSYEAKGNSDCCRLGFLEADEKSDFHVGRLLGQALGTKTYWLGKENGWAIFEPGMVFQTCFKEMHGTGPLDAPNDQWLS